MTYSINDIEQLALANLSPEERDILADRLWRGVHGDVDEATWMEEIERRLDDVNSGKSTPLSKDDVDAHFRKKYGWN
jgi:putative addiction module component (TIGR02574 family)